jgi:flagellin-like protein
MMLKGVSPLVATIMLIAFTMIIAGIISLFATNLVQSTQTQIKTCSDAKAILYRAVYNTTSDDLTLTINNYGKVNLRFRAELAYSNSNLHPGGLAKVNATSDVAAGQIGVWTLGNVTDDLTSVTIISTSCDAPCAECPGAQDVLMHNDIKGIGYT